MGHFDVLIIGAGPAGMTAALYCARAGVEVGLIEKDYIPGGQMNNAVKIENYPGVEPVAGDVLAQKMFANLGKYKNLEYIIDEVKSVRELVDEGGERLFVVSCENDTHTATAVIEAIGMEHLPLPNTDDSIDFVHYCATCDGPLYREEPVAVIGDGNTAVTYALELSKYCSTVYLFTLTDKLFGEEVNNNLLRHQGNVIQIVGSASLAYSKTYGNYVKCNGDAYPVAAAFVAIGMKRRTIQLDGVCEQGYFRAGDCNTGNQFHQVSIAVGDGTNAALKALDWVRKCSLK